MENLKLEELSSDELILVEGGNFLYRAAKELLKSGIFNEAWKGIEALAEADWDSGSGGASDHYHKGSMFW